MNASKFLASAVATTAVIAAILYVLPEARRLDKIFQAYDVNGTHGFDRNQADTAFGPDVRIMLPIVMHAG